MHKYIFPNYKKNILNISATFADYLGIENDIHKLKVISKELRKNYHNVVFIILDGLGFHVLKQHLPRTNILNKHIIQKLTSVFPSTTTNATTTLISCSYPGQHCWLGWSLYFKELDKCLDIYLNKVSSKNEFIDPSYIIEKIPYTAYYNNSNNEDIKVYSVLPGYVKVGASSNNFYFNDVDKMFENLSNICKTSDRKFIYSYYGEPDYTMHDFGVTSQEANDKITLLSTKVEALHRENPDTLIVITADHGQIDVDEYIDIYKDQALLDCLKRPLSLEVRATSFQIINNRKKEFISIFKKNYGKYFRLIASKKLIKNKVFGPIVKAQAHEFLGDFIAIAKNNKKGFAFSEAASHFKGHHTGLSPKEMHVPLIIIGSK